MSNQQLSSALDPQRWITQTRQDLLTQSGLQPDDLTKAINRHRKLLDATTRRGDDAHDVQMRAVQAFYDLLVGKAQHESKQAAGVEVVIEDGRVIVRAVSK